MPVLFILKTCFTKKNVFLRFNLKNRQKPGYNKRHTYTLSSRKLNKCSDLTETCVLPIVVFAEYWWIGGCDWSTGAKKIQSNISMDEMWIKYSLDKSLKNRSELSFKFLLG